MPAAYLALDDVNSKKDLLPDFQLTLHSNDSEVGQEKSISFVWNGFQLRADKLQ